jgi:hypothetical protein
MHPHDPDAKIAKMKNGRTHPAHKAEHAIDLETGAIVGVTVQDADEGDTTTIQQTLPESAEQLDAVAAVTDDAVADALWDRHAACPSGPLGGVRDRLRRVVEPHTRLWLGAYGLAARGTSAFHEEARYSFIERLPGVRGTF